MSRLPALHWRAVVKAFRRLGWYWVRQQGSHMIYQHDDNLATLSIPRHDIVKRGTLRELLNDAGISVDEFEAARLGRRRR
jgi:predicted RNA binding protein YcfA (HicA-like mRNA interferase family)